MTRIARRFAGVMITAIAVAVALSSCEDTLTPQLSEAVRVASLPDLSLTIQAPANGSVSPSGQLTVKESEPLSITATPNSGYSFLYWQKVSGDGSVVFADENARNTSVRLSGGDAVIAAFMGNTPRSLTVIAGSNGSVSPSGEVVVQDGAARNITATPSGLAYEFASWEQTAGGGSVVFGSQTAASTTVTVTGGDAEIRGNFALKAYTITIIATTGGTASTGSVSVQHGVASATVTATPGTGYVFANWTVTSGSGISFAPSSTSTNVQITATAGDATVQANFLPTYTLSISSQAGGFTSPSGTRTVTSGQPLAVTAYPSSTYRFDGWEQTAGSGTATFSNAASASTTITVTGGNASVRANFRKETVTLTEVGSDQYSDNTSTNPNDATGVYYHDGYLYVIGAYSGSAGVVRRWNVSTPTAPSTGFNDYFYLNGLPSSIIGNGTYLFIGTSTTLYRIDISGFGHSATATSVAHGIRDLSLASSTSFYAARTNGNIAGYYSGLSSGDMISDSGWSFDYITAVPGGVAAVMEDNGAHQLGTYEAVIGGTQGVTSPNDSVALHGGTDLDPGWAGKAVRDVDWEYVIVPVYDKNGTARVKFHEVTSLSSIYPSGSATLSKRANALATDTSGENDYYVFAAAGSNDGATVYVVDMASKSNPVVRTTTPIAGFNSADAIHVNGSFVYVVVDDPTSGTNLKPTVKVFRITKG